MDFKSNKIKIAIAAIILVVIGLASTRFMQSGEDATGFLRNRGSQPCSVLISNNEPYTHTNTIYTDRGYSHADKHFFTIEPSGGCKKDLSLTGVSLLCLEQRRTDRSSYYRDLDFVNSIKTHSNMNVNFGLSGNSIFLSEPIRELTPFYFDLASQRELDANNQCDLHLAKIKFSQDVNIRYQSQLHFYHNYDGNDYEALPLRNLISRPYQYVINLRNSPSNYNTLQDGSNVTQNFKLYLMGSSRSNAKLGLLSFRIEKSNYEIDAIKLVMSQNGETFELPAPFYVGRWDADRFDIQFDFYNADWNDSTVSFLNQPLVTNDSVEYHLKVNGRRINESIPATLKTSVLSRNFQYCTEVQGNGPFNLYNLGFNCYIGLYKSDENPIELRMN